MYFISKTNHTRLAGLLKDIPTGAVFC
uniref:Uncharacterized protein n=1 Tax=Anguilla anguilla TaxID=7936 RepID=A0A0E9VY78_ANGAN